MYFTTPGAYTNRYSIFVRPLCVLEHGRVSENYTGNHNQCCKVYYTLDVWKHQFDKMVKSNGTTIHPTGNSAKTYFITLTHDTHFILVYYLNDFCCEILQRITKNMCRTRMHSSRMRTARCSGRLSCHTCPPPLSPRMLPSPHMPPTLCHACPHFSAYAPWVRTPPCGQNS